MTVRSIVLLGSDHTELEQIAIEELTPNVAIGISRGRFPKGYPHLDPNEDAVFAATDGTTTVLAVADGHHGFDAAREAILTISDTTPSVINGEAEKSSVASQQQQSTPLPAGSPTWIHPTTRAAPPSRSVWSAAESSPPPPSATPCVS
jgi:hypothetical protein